MKRQTNHSKESVTGMNKYYCKYCGKTVYRDSTKQWVKSYCVFASKKIHLIKLKP